MINLWDAVQIASEVYEPDDAIGLAGLFIIGLPSLVTAVLSSAILWRQRKTAAKVTAIKTGVEKTNAQVVNNHEGKPVLRSDVDEILLAVKAQGVEQKRQGQMLDGQGVSIAELRGEVKGLTHRVDRLTEQ